MRNLHNDAKSQSIHIMPTTDHSDLKHFKKQLTTKTRNFTSVALTPSGKTALLNVQTAPYAPQHDQC
jgi:hypothetical protein